MCAGNSDSSSPKALANATTTLRSGLNDAGPTDVGESEAARKLLIWFKTPAEGEIELAVKVAIAKRLGLTRYLSIPDRAGQ